MYMWPNGQGQLSSKIPNHKMAVDDFWKAVFRRRCCAAAFWSGAAGVCVSLVFRWLLGLCCGSLTPADWDAGSVFGLVCVWCCAVLFAASHSLVYSVPLVVHRQWLQVLAMALLPTHLLFGALTVGCSATAALGTVRAVHGDTLAYGALLGLWVGVGHLVGRKNHLSFPLVPQPKLFQLKGCLKDHLLSALLTAGKALRVFVPVYVVAAPWLHSTGTMPSHCSTVLGCVQHLANPLLLLHLLIVGWMVCTIWNTTLHLFTLFQTQPIVFPVMAVYSGEADRTLSAALAPRAPALLRSLALQDLRNLAFKSAWRRQQVYSLNQAGRSQPWDDLSSACLSVIDRLSVGLSSGLPMATDSPPPLTLGQAVQPFDGGPVSWHPSTEVLDSPLGVTHRQMQRERARLWQQAHTSPSNHMTPAEQTLTGPGKLGTVPSNLVRSLRVWTSATTKAVLQWRVFAFFLEEVPDSAEQVTFKDYRADVWAVDALSELAKCSLKEDKFGVVQKDLPGILSKLIKLSKALDGVVRCPVPLARSKTHALDTHAKYAVKAAVLLALNRLADTFRDQHRAFQLSPVDAAYLQSCCS